MSGKHITVYVHSHYSTFQKEYTIDENNMPFLHPSLFKRSIMFTISITFSPRVKYLMI
jgi:hypothetical protein